MTNRDQDGTTVVTKRSYTRTRHPGLRPFAAFNWIGYENGYMDIMANKRFGPSSNMGGLVLRDSAVSIPIGARRARRFGKLLRETRLAPREVAVLQPSTATVNGYPYFHINWSFSPFVQEAKNFHDLLFDKNYQHGYVLEESLFDGKAELSDYPVVILPYATYLADGMNNKLLEYVRNGGTVIASGLPGLYDKYGRDDGSFVKEVFGNLETRYIGDDYIWLFSVTPVALKDTATVVVEDDGKAILLSATYGQGTVLIATQPYLRRPGSERLVPHFYATLNKALDGPRITTLYDRFESVHRESPDGRQFLFVLNYDLANALEDRLIFKGEYRKCLDLGIGPQFAIPLLPHTIGHTMKLPVEHGAQFIDNHTPAGTTSFWLRLEPGEGTVIELVK